MQIGNPVVSSQNDMSPNYISAHMYMKISVIVSILIIINIYFYT